MNQPTDKAQVEFEAWLSTLPRRPHTPAAYDWCLAAWQASRTAALNEAILLFDAQGLHLLMSPPPQQALKDLRDGK